MIVLTIGIILCIGAVVYCYMLYPPLIEWLAARSTVVVRADSEHVPAVTVILSVHNEERVIESCLDSLLALDYPADKLKILVGSDGSCDATNTILERYTRSHAGVRAYYFADQRGKIAVLNDLVREASTPLLFFTDADIRIDRNALRLQTRNFADPTVGAVAGMNDIYSPESSAVYDSEKGYTDAEQRIRTAESTYCSSVGLSGANYSLLRSLWVPLPDGLIHDDFFVMLSVLRQGYRIISEERAVSRDLFVRTLRDEFHRKVRSASRGFHTLTYFQELLLPRGGKVALLLWSHKLLRWLSPILALCALMLTAVGAAIFGGIGFEAVLCVAAGLTIISAIGLVTNQLGVRARIVDRLTWFYAMNIAYVWGALIFVTHSDHAIWKAATRAEVSGGNQQVNEH